MSSRPFAGTGTSKLTALINAKNPGRRLVHGVDFVFGKIKVIQAPDYNTEVQILSLREGFRGQTIYYRRPHLNEYHLHGGLVEAVRIYRDEFCPQQILTELAEGTGIDFEERDLVRTQHRRGDRHEIYIDSERSLAWSGGTLRFDAINLRGRLTLDGRLRKTQDGRPMLSI